MGVLRRSERAQRPVASGRSRQFLTQQDSDDRVVAAVIPELRPIDRAQLLSLVASGDLEQQGSEESIQVMEVEPQPQEVNRRSPRFYDDLIEGVQRRGEQVRQIAQNLEDRDLELTPEVRQHLQSELEDHRLANEADLILLRQQGRVYLPRPGDANHELAIALAVAEVQNSPPRGSNVTVSSNNTAIDMDRSELFGPEDNLANEVSRILREAEG